MPRINTHYVSGPIDELVYGAADAAGLPELVSAVFDGEGQTWRWNVSPEGSDAQREVILRSVVPVPGAATVEIYASAIAWRARKNHRLRLLSRVRVPAPGDIDEAWLTASLRAAHEVARQL